VERKEERKYRGATAGGKLLLVVDWAPINACCFDLLVGEKKE
jgi:hypothetical protein